MIDIHTRLELFVGGWVVGGLENRADNNEKIRPVYVGAHISCADGNLVDDFSQMINLNFSERLAVECRSALSKRNSMNSSLLTLEICRRLGLHPAVA